MQYKQTMKPVFIVGAARSGTKLLRDLIHECHACERIPYDINFVWRYGNERLKHDLLSPETLTLKNKKFIKQAIFKLREMKNASQEPSVFVEKTVSNSLRPLFVHNCFPESKIIHLVRNGFAVTESACRVWNLPNQSRYLLSKLKYFPLACYKYAFWYLLQEIEKGIKKTPRTWGPRYQGIDYDLKTKPLHEVCALQWFFSITISFSELNKIPNQQVKTISYEELIKNKNCIESICTFLNIDPSGALAKWDKVITNQNNLKWKNKLTSNQLSEISNVFNELPVELKYLNDLP
jgi:hypothetical protein